MAKGEKSFSSFWEKRTAARVPASRTPLGPIGFQGPSPSPGPLEGHFSLRQSLRPEPRIPQASIELSSRDSGE